VAALLGVRLAGRERVAILGAQGLGLALAREFATAEVPVVFLDSNPQNCRRAEEQGFPVIFGNALQERTLQRARFESVRIAIGLTPNDTLNGLFVARAQELFRTPEAYVALQWLGAGATPEFLGGTDTKVLFEGLHDVERWDVRSNHDEIRIVRRVFEEAVEGGAADSSDPGERFVILAVQRGERLLPMSTEFEPREDDVAVVAVHVPDFADADRILRARGWCETATEELVAGEVS
jgi:NAD(P)-dependent dehydrogenase (short-subunit alcohol dehydrogenase family)